MDKMASKLMKILRFIETIRHLKFEQFFFRIVRIFIKKSNTILYKKIELIDFNSKNFYWINSPQVEYNNNEIYINKKKYALNSNFDFEKCSYLEKYVGNYHGILLDDNFEEKAKNLFIENWIDSCSEATNVRWEPYPTSIRLINWVKAILSKKIASEKAESLLNFHADIVLRKLERHLGGNHLLTNAKALIFYGFASKSHGEKYLDIGLSIFENQLSIQQLETGYNYELSPMYHALFVEDLLDIYSLGFHNEKINNFLLKNKFHDRIYKALTCLEFFTCPDGSVCRFNDSVDFVAPTLTQLIQFAEENGISFTETKQYALAAKELNGYYLIRNEAITVYFDGARVGPDELPGHAHADTLSIEVFVNGFPFLRNIGTSCYGDDAQRMYERSSSAHNNPVLNSLNSSDVWSGFRVGKRAGVIYRDSKLDLATEIVTAEAAHNGYSSYFSKGSRIVSRKISLSGNSLIIEDNVHQASNSDELNLYFHFHNEITEIKEFDERSLIINLGKFKILMSFDEIIVRKFANKMAVRFYDSRDSISIQVNSKKPTVISKIEILNENSIYH